MKLIIVSKSLNKLENINEIEELIRKEVDFGNNLKPKIIFPEDSKYKIDQIKKILKTLTKKKDLENEYINIFMKAESLSDVTQNALLKTLEESDYSIILITSNFDTLLPTLISRCQVLRIKDEEINQSQNQEINMKTISSISKLTREEVIKILESQLVNSDIDNILKIQDSIDKLNSNCKIESVLYDLINEIN